MSRKLSASEIIAIEERCTGGTYAKSDIVFVRGEGACLYDADGVERQEIGRAHV